jgi:hypothetical protein
MGIKDRLPLPNRASRIVRPFGFLMTVQTVSFAFALMLVAMPAVNAGDGACDWTGTWDTSSGKMELVQIGNAEEGADVTGTAILPQNRNINCDIVAIVLDNMLIGYWSKYPSYGPPDDAGDIQFTISEDCSSFDGKWRYGYGNGDWNGDWTGSRVGSSKTISMVSVCASAKPSITGGSEFERAKFTIGGTLPQEVRIYSPAENFAIVKEHGGIVYQVIDGKSWGSRTLDPGTYILSCSGGGAIGLMSATVCIEYPGIVETPTGTEENLPEVEHSSVLPEVSTGKESKPSLPQGPIEKIVVRPSDNLDVGVLVMKVGKEQRFSAWGEDANGNKKSVTVEEWEVNDESIGSIDKDGLFKAEAEGEVKIRSTAENLTGVFPITVSALDPMKWNGTLRFEDENGKEMNWPGGGYTIRCTYGVPPDDVVLITKTDSKGKYGFVVPTVQAGLTVANIHLVGSIPAPAGYVWQPEVVSIRWQGPLYKWSEVMLVRLKKQSMYIKGHLTHQGDPVKFAEVRLLDPNGRVVANDTSTETGDYHIPLPDLPTDRYRLTAKSKGGYTTLHNWLINKQDIWVDLPITEPKTINIEMISWADKIGYTGP